MNKTPKKIGMVSLGCPKNLVDSEALLGDLGMSGYEMTPDESEADVIIVNTCGFLQSAVKESIDTILEMAGHKTGGRCEQLIVTGCLAERHPEDLLEGDSGNRPLARHQTVSDVEASPERLRPLPTAQPHT